MFRGDRLEAIKINQKRKKTSTLSNLITIICLGIFFYSLLQLSNIAWDYYDNRKNMGEAREIYYQDEDKVSASHGETRPQFHSLLGMNRDITGWIRLDDTPIDYPILQAQDNNYYLDKNYKKQSTRAGSIFMDFRNNVELGSRNTILYGHDMKDGSMFGNLKKYLQTHFFNQHRLLYYDTLYESYEAEVFSVYRTTTDFYYIQTDFSSKTEYASFIKNIQDRSIFQTGITLTEDDSILTLSTCDYELDPDKGRLVVHAKLIKRT
jgi:sortase B